MSFSSCFKTASELENNIDPSSPPAIVERWINRCYEAYGKAGLSAANRQQNEQVFAKVKDILTRQRIFYAENPKRCDISFEETCLKMISKHFYWLTYLQLDTDVENGGYDNLCDKIDTITDEYEESSSKLSRESLLWAMLEGTQETSYAARAAIFFKMAKFLFHKGIKFSQIHLTASPNHGSIARNAFEDIRRPLEDFKKVSNFAQLSPSVSAEVKKFLKNLDEEMEILELETDTEIIQFNGRMSLAKANKKHHDLLNEQEDLDYDLVFDVYDLYHHAWSQVRDKSVELEAETLSRMGIYQYKMLQLPNGNLKALDYFRKCTELAASLKPKDVTITKWHQEASECLRELELWFLKSDFEKQEVEKTQYVKELQAADEFLKKYSKDGRNETINGKEIKKMAREISQKYLPRLKIFDLEGIEQMDEQKPRPILYKLIQVYHPDKQAAEDRLWFFICGRISTCLINNLYRLKPQ